MIDASLELDATCAWLVDAEKVAMEIAKAIDRFCSVIMSSLILTGSDHFFYRVTK